ncbi:MAG: hypothetical protein SVV03_00555 [Candidatus Nanohaloarchaea archaeon]|nr:hypothetical protein [Candidatus Nanohaloarchaea archaeon]
MQSSEKRLENYFEERFGVDRDFWNSLKVHERSSSLWVVSGDTDLNGEFTASGIRALRKANLGFKPTTYMLQILGSEIDRNIAELSGKELDSLVFDREILQGFEDLEKGYVALKFRGSIIGCGKRTGRGLESQISKSRSRELKSCMV